MCHQEWIVLVKLSLGAGGFGQECLQMQTGLVNISVGVGGIGQECLQAWAQFVKFSAGPDRIGQTIKKMCNLTFNGLHLKKKNLRCKCNKHEGIL